MDPISMAVAGAGAIEAAFQVAGRLGEAGKAAKAGTAYFKNGSLIDIAQVARVEPLAMVDADCMNVEYLSDVMQSLHSIFSGYYLQAINLIATIGSVSVANKLSPLNPNRANAFEQLGDWRMAAESYTHRLPTSKNKTTIALESDDGKGKSTTDREALSTMREVANLSVGKMFNVTLREGSNSAVIPVSIRLMTSTIPTNAMIGLFTFKDSFDMDLKERWHMYRAGRLSFIRDLVLCRDLIDKHRTAMITDKSNTYAQIIGRENGNRAAGVKNLNPSLATASNLAVLSSDTLAQIEQRLNGKFSNPKVRATLFDNTNLMILAVVDKAWERVTFYHRGITASTQVSVRDMKASNKGSGPDITDIMKAYITGSNPSL